MGSKDKKEQDDAFNVLQEITDVLVDEEEKARLAEKAEKKRLKKEMTKEERQAQREINRKNREKKKSKKDLNKKRKRGELTDDEEEEKEEPKEPVLDADGNVVEPVKKPKAEKKKKEMEYGIWVGNLSYGTTLATIKEFFKECGEITRIKCPKGNGAKNYNKGFAYIFFSTPEEAAKGVAMSEKKLEGRSLLIKDSENFERADGSKAPTEAEKREIKKQKNPPCPTLFLGNLSFDTTEKSIREQFEWAGEIRKVRMATFEDSGKCKGFGYVDYHEVESATKAIRAPDKHMLDGRKVRVEFGSAEAHMRSKPWLMREKQKAERPHNTSNDAAADSTAAAAAASASEEQPYKRQRKDYNQGGEHGEEKREFRERRPKKAVNHEKVKPGQALYAAQRQKPSVQEFKGTKVTFD
ncbi:hypothetical protein HMPREF1544_04954 [Mucor circinelloides 1006PhL]|uniref:RRM domain-containing protein n=1 Tax=Mucor circinelloides f. circinelloides (strain 1006PhL) TaxID=1220926 RepID=S2JD87_MUCC1|nr:hypothetical protein HMPREF1544_04954 [Mucor circinelloides 1006PhL]KAG1104449.1 hypothetical protein G6F42_017088 [Rhizopus arrhizus]